MSDFASTSREEVFAGVTKVQLLNKVICQHFYRQGMLDIAEELAKVRTSSLFGNVLIFLQNLCACIFDFARRLAQYFAGQ